MVDSQIAYTVTCQKQPDTAARPSSVKLAGLKFGIYNPGLPTLRKMDRDDVVQKLPSDHARTTTSCSSDAFRTLQYHRNNYDKVRSVSPMPSSQPRTQSTTRYTEDWNVVLRATLETRQGQGNLEGGTYQQPSKRLQQIQKCKTYELLPQCLEVRGSTIAPQLSKNHG